MPTSFTHGELFPVVFRLITDRTFKFSAFVTHQELVRALLESEAGRLIVDAAVPNSASDKQGIASNMVAWFSKAITEGSKEYGELLERTKIGKTWAYRSTQTSPTTPDESVTLIPDVDLSVLEGTPQLVSHIRRERSPELVKAKLHQVLAESGRLECICCGFDAEITFPGLGFPVVEVHHRTPLSKYEVPTPTSLDDLVVICPTCHRALHRAGDVSVEDFKKKYFLGG